MANDKVAIWNSGLKFGRVPANGELLIGDGVGLNLSTLVAGSGVTITNSSGGISISATGSGGTVTSVTATSPLASSGGATPDISLGTVGANKGGTGQTSLTLNNVLLGNGTSAVQFVAPGTSGNVLTSNGTTWASTAPAGSWTLLKKTADQSVANTTVLADITSFTFSMAANATYAVRSIIAVTIGSGGIKLAANGTAAATLLRIGGLIVPTSGSLIIAPTATVYANPFYNAVPSAAINLIKFDGIVQNGANPSTFSIQVAQSSSNASATIIEKGSFLEYAVIA